MRRDTQPEAPSSLFALLISAAVPAPGAPQAEQVGLILLPALLTAALDGRAGSRPNNASSLPEPWPLTPSGMAIAARPAPPQP